MKTYEILVAEHRIYDVRYFVEAESEEEAREMAERGETVSEEEENFREVTNRTIIEDPEEVGEVEVDDLDDPDASHCEDCGTVMHEGDPEFYDSFDSVYCINCKDHRRAKTMEEWDAEEDSPIWCETNDCEQPSCHRCFPRKDCTDHRKCQEQGE